MSVIRASATTSVKPVSGAISSFSEHGSGSYSSNETISLSPSKIFISQNLKVDFHESWTHTRKMKKRISPKPPLFSYGQRRLSLIWDKDPVLVN
jgi:hypothetical protein